MNAETKPAPTEPSDPELSEARTLGRQAAERHDQGLRQAESRDREERLTELAWFGTGSPASDSTSAPQDSYEVSALRRRVEEQDYYLAAIENSIAWRAIQTIRGWLGRAW